MLRYQKQRNRNALAVPGANEFIVVLDHLKAGFNVPKIFRSAEAFGAHEVHLIGIGPFDPAPGKGSFKKVPARFYDSFAESCADLQQRGYTLFMMEPEGGTRLSEVTFPAKSAFLFGHEEIGFSFERSDYPGVQAVTIPQYGHVESLNVSVAASIVMYEYVRQLKT